MKTIIKLFVVIALMMPVAAWAQGHDQHDPGKKDHEMHNKVKHDKEGKVMTLNGRLIGLTCFLKHGTFGEKHKSCARTCAEKGLPLGLKTADGKIYQVMGEGHDDLKTVNSKLIGFLEEDVTVVGKVFEKSGLQAIVIEKIKK